MRIIVAAVFVLYLFIPLTHAEIYKWTDEKGTVHFTEDPATIPEKYQDKAKIKDTPLNRNILHEWKGFFGGAPISLPPLKQKQE
ncbi:MAG: DUF4124 domain-containing protein [Thermodesulfobacteriota bacterium]